MAYTAIATILHNSDADQTALNFAIDFARHHNAHLHVLCAGIDATEPGFYYAGAHAIAVQQNFDATQEQADRLETLARRRLIAEDIKWDVQAVTVMPGGLDPFLSDNMRFFDLVVLPAPHQGANDRTDVMTFEACLFGADVPVLVIPSVPKLSVTFDNIKIAWDDGTEAMAAARAAIPLLKTATTTTISIVDPPLHAPDRSDPGGKLANYLARQGAKVEVAIHARTQPSVASQLLMRANETNVDLIVMGAYGHSRMREAILGGVTRDILGLTNLPLLMAH
ncbi:nucleotide-binding universal stress UspA family protein [Loktanella ponticola]|uniref:Nucleotide-binding universal stress UspA family protein n=1 Tax=Yoonia ponticola TaxID=1524255 RepID=A0A7W9EYA2_9RHOB|nr:universal stress protein [Yoonia ponticola]MBB5722558.1 nucleotide-binding universal stress UspA family protein [Yoonia ponticola]